MISQPWHLLCSVNTGSKGVFMATRDDRKRQSEQTSSIDDDMVRGRADEMEDRDSESSEFEDTEDLNDEEQEEEGR